MLELEEEREQLNKINQELMVANADANDLDKKLEQIHKKIFRSKKVIDDLLNRKET